MLCLKYTGFMIVQLQQFSQDVDVPKGICNECEEGIGAICFVPAVTELLHQFNLTRLQGNESDGLFQILQNILCAAFKSGSDSQGENSLKPFYMYSFLLLLHPSSPPPAKKKKRQTKETQQQIRDKPLKQKKPSPKPRSHHSTSSLTLVMWEGILKVVVSAN